MEHKSRTTADHKNRALQVLKAGGHHSVKETVAKAVHAHEKHDHPGKPLTKLAGGGKVKKNPGVAVIVHTGSDQAAQRMAMHQGMQAGAVMGAKAAQQQHMAPGPGPGMAPPPGSPPGMAQPPMPMGARPPGMAQGGGIKAPDQAGAHGGMGRLQKMKAYGAPGPVGGAPETVKVKGHIRRKAGGKCE